MDAINFIKERGRMCKSSESCFCCPAYNGGDCLMVTQNWCPGCLDSTLRKSKCGHVTCYDCRKEFYSKEINDNEQP